MDREQIALRLTMESLGLPFAIETFDNRLILQKAVYLAQAAGVHLGYYYQWYLHGPYSPSLTGDAYAIADELAQGPDESQGCQLDDKSQERLRKLRDIIASKGPQTARELELLASVHFLIDRKQVPGADIKEIHSTLARVGKDFTEEEVRGAIEELVEGGLLKG